MSGWCSCDIDYAEAEIVRRSAPRARKAYTCHECGGPINPGDEYDRWDQLEDGAWFAFTVGGEPRRPVPQTPCPCRYGCVDCQPPRRGVVFTDRADSRPVPQTTTPILAARLAVVRGASQLGNPDGFDTEDIWRELKTALAYLDQAIREGKR